MKEKIKKLLSELSKNRIYSGIAFCLSVLLLFTCCTVSFAWLVDYFRSGDLGFTAGELDDIILEIAKVNHSDGTEELREYEECTDLGSHPTEDDDAYSIDLDKLSFGMIDNVAMLKPENIVYFRLSIPKKNGANVSLSMGYGEGDFLELYENVYDGDIVTGLSRIEADDDEAYAEIIDSITGLETENECYVRYSALLSNTDLAADELSTLSFTEFHNMNSGDTLNLINDDIENAGDYYYIYIRVEPNLGLLSHSIEYISPYMPCYVYYKVAAEIEVH